MDPVPDPILPEKFLGYSWESDPSLGWQSDLPNRQSIIIIVIIIMIIIITIRYCNNNNNDIIII